MPLTFPSHAAAILPLLHLPGARRLSASALVIGTTTPDLVYLVGTLGAASHRPSGLLLFCLPAGLLAFVYVEALVLPILGGPLVALAPRRLRPHLARVLQPRPLPRGFAAWIAIAVAVLLGAATHQLWDGFTHAWLWPAKVLYPQLTLPIFGRPILLSRILQHTSSLLGLALVLAYVARTTPAADIVEHPVIPVHPRPGRRLVAVLAAPLLGGLVAALISLQSPDPLITRALWNAAWSAVAWFVALLGVLCLLLRVRVAPPPPSG
jgi:hypothetical protein